MIIFVCSKEEITKKEKEKQSVKIPKNANNVFGKDIFFFTFAILEITKAQKFKSKVKGNTLKKKKRNRSDFQRMNNPWNSFPHDSTLTMELIASKYIRIHKSPVYKE